MTNTLHRCQGQPRRRGLSTVEAAIALPIFFALLFGLLEYGWAFLKAQQINGAAREGARAGIVDLATAADVQAMVDQMMADAGLAGSGYTTTIAPDPSSLAAGQLLTVRVEVAYAGNIELVGIPLIPTPSTLAGETTMAREGPK